MELSSMRLSSELPDPFDAAGAIRDFVDYLMPELKPHETAVYLFLLRRSYFESGSGTVRVGQRSMAPQYGRGKQSAAPSRNQVIKQLNVLEEKGCLVIGDTNRAGTLYKVNLPREIELVKAKLFAPEQSGDEDFFTDPTRRLEIYTRDGWRCGYCGEPVTQSNASLDHIVPQCAGGSHRKANLRTACLMCNSIKSGKTEAEAALPLLKSIRERQQRSSAR
jgi:hypothetical protein